ncbi:MAG: tetratricopeptide repeat protein [Dehalococcoidia bacterium]|nr:tetratricopeptide repeat protein [Dehalococcoidia bacterium]
MTTGSAGGSPEARDDATGQVASASEAVELRVTERVRGPEHPDTLRSRSNLAFGYRALGLEDDAIRVEGGWVP